MKRLVSVALVSVMLCSPVFAEEAKEGPDGGSVAAAVVSDLVYVPGKVGVCVGSAALWTVGMFLTAGVLYKECGELVHSACTGKWILTGEDFAE